MTRRFVRSMAVAGTIGLSSLGAGPAAVAVTTPVVHSVPAPLTDADVATDAGDEEDEEPAVVDLPTAAAALGMELPALHAALHADGATLAGVSEARGVPAARLEAALVAEAARRLDAAATAGRLSPWEAQARRTVLPDVVAAAVQADRSVDVV